MGRDEFREQIEAKLKLLNQTTWERRVPKNVLDEWISQFEELESCDWDEQAQVLFLLSHFLYFGHAEIRSLLRSLYRDLIRAPALRDIRRTMNDTLDADLITREYQVQHERYRYLALGNPSESSTHLLYYFRQENSLPKNLFIHPHQIFEQTIADTTIISQLRNGAIERYIFLDDICGSGDQAVQYGRDVVGPLKALSPGSRVGYFVLFGTSYGLDRVRNNTSFDNVEAVYELDDSFRSLESNSRIFQGDQPSPERQIVHDTCVKYGNRLSPQEPLGYNNDQLLLGFSHNTPDNTVPIFWGGNLASSLGWKPIFTRYPKVSS